MAFQKYTAPPPPPPPPPKPKPQIKFVRTVIQFTEDGLAHLGEIAGKLKESSHVHLWHDPETSEVAVTPASADDRDAFSFENGKIQAKKFFEKMKIAWPVKHHSKTLEPHDDGVKVTVGTPPEPAAAKPPKKKWQPRDPLPTRGRRSAEQKAWLATDEGVAWLAEQEKK